MLLLSDKSRFLLWHSNDGVRIWRLTSWKNGSGRVQSHLKSHFLLVLMLAFRWFLCEYQHHWSGDFTRMRLALLWPRITPDKTKTRGGQTESRHGSGGDHSNNEETKRPWTKRPSVPRLFHNAILSICSTSREQVKEHYMCVRHDQGLEKCSQGQCTACRAK